MLILSLTVMQFCLSSPCRIDSFVLTGDPQWKWASKLHFADTVDWSCQYVASDCPNNECVVGAIFNYTDILSSSTDQNMQYIATKFLTVHNMRVHWMCVRVVVCVCLYRHL